MRAALVLAGLFLVTPPVAPASDFDWMTRAFARMSGTTQTHIPFFGLARFAVAVAHPGGVSGLKLAIFEHPNLRPEEFAKVADSTVGPGWKPMIRVRDQSGEISNIYVQPEGRYLKLLIATLDKGEAVLVQVRIRPEELIKFIDEQKHNHHA